MEKSDIIGNQPVNGNRSRASTAGSRFSAILPAVFAEKILHKTGRYVARPEPWVVHNLQVQRYSRLDSLDYHGLQSPLHPGDRQFTSTRVNDNFGDHGVVKR